MKLLALLTATGIISAHCFGQSDSAEIKPSSDSIKTKANLTLGLVYSNNANYYGQRAAENMPYAAAAANYKLRSGIYFTGMAYKLLNDTVSSWIKNKLGYFRFLGKEKNRLRCSYGFSFCIDEACRCFYYFNTFYFVLSITFFFFSFTQ